MLSSLFQLGLACSLLFIQQYLWRACIPGGTGNKGGVREDFHLALSNTHARCVLDAGVCHPKPPCKTKALTPKVVWKVGCWWLTVPSLGITILLSKGAISPKDVCPLWVSPHPMTGLWVGSKTQPPCLNSGQFWRATSVLELPVRSTEVSATITTPWCNLSLLNSVSLIHALPGVPESTLAPCSTSA